MSAPWQLAFVLFPVVSAVPGIGSIAHHTLRQDLWTKRRNECTHCFMNENCHLIYPYSNAMRQIFLTLILQTGRLRLWQATICLLFSVHVQDLSALCFEGLLVLCERSSTLGAGKQGCEKAHPRFHPLSGSPHISLRKLVNELTHGRLLPQICPQSPLTKCRLLGSILQVKCEPASGSKP